MNVSRRHFLLLATAFLASLTGCSSIENYANSESNRSSSSRVKLDTIGVGNWHSEPHTIHFLVRKDNEIVLWKAVELSEHNDSRTDQETIKDGLQSKSRQYEIYARLDDRDTWESVLITDGDICRVDIIVQKSGEISISSRTDCT